MAWSANEVGLGWWPYRGAPPLPLLSLVPSLAPKLAPTLHPLPCIPTTGLSLSPPCRLRIYSFCAPCCPRLAPTISTYSLLYHPLARCCHTAATMATADNHSDSAPHSRTRSPSEVEAAHGILPSHGIHINFPPTAESGRPQMIRHLSNPSYQSPIRHHRRTPSRSGAVKETLNARTHYGSSDDDGAAVHRINQYVIKQEIGRGSFGAVHLAVDQYGQEFVRSTEALVQS